MGSFCSKTSAVTGGHTVLSSPTNSEDRGAPSRPANPRTAAAEAAERRLKAAQERGTNASNPKQGRLAAQVVKQNSKPVTESREEASLVWD